MKELFKKLLLKGLEPFDAFPTRATPKDRFQALLRQLRPYQTDHPLIRLGPDEDGGYLVPDDLEGITVLFSPGVSHQSRFELACAELGMQAFMADKTVDAPSESHQLFHFTKKHIGAFSDEETMTLDDWQRERAGDASGDFMLQMDIEGSEYEVILSMSRALQERFRIMIVEIHQLHWLWSREYFDIASRAVNKLLQTHACVHVHPNNWRGAFCYRGLEIPQVAEITLLRRDRAQRLEPATQFPHPLDRPNRPGPDLPLPRSWYQ